SPEHGFPLRLLAPSKYAYKSAKWVRGFKLPDVEELGFWESRGYSNTAEPWRADRHSD
ncbi:MAG: molybdopterin-dependent oxidoreductase, partial [Dehalococcoidia bacterium]|nr:molybdopterin-dependent oxidoreductase [Dehalococcoidia bacterium]